MSGKDFQEERYIHGIQTSTNYGPSGSAYLPTGPAYAIMSAPSAVEGMLSAKLDRTQSRIEALIEAIDKRRLIKEVNLYGIERDVTQCQNLLFDMGYKIYRRDKEWASLETKKIDLERDRRMEQSAYFRDLTLLGKELRDTVEYKQSILDKAQMLGGNMIQNEIQL